MANVILPIMKYFALGATMNMLNYDDYKERPGLFRDADFVLHEHPPVLNASYYILQDDRLPYDAMGLPIDLVLLLKNQWTYPKSIAYHTPQFLHDNPLQDIAAIVLITEFSTGKQMISPSAEPVPGWQETIPETSTHYAEEITHGTKCFAKLEFSSGFPGDVQIIKRIITEAMGRSGQCTNKDIPAFTELWKFAWNAANESPDLRRKGIRGRRLFVHSFRVTCRTRGLPYQAERSFEDFLAYLPNITFSYSERNPITDGDQILSVRFRPLHDLDGQYRPMEINKQTEEYLTSAHKKLEDVIRVEKKTYLSQGSQEHKDMKKKFHSNAMDLWVKLQRLLYEGTGKKLQSIYEDIDVHKFDDVFRQYEAGLDRGEKNYISAWNKILEMTDMKCTNSSFKPTHGILVATEDEVTNIRAKRYRRGGAEACKETCWKEERCRAIGYDEKHPKICRIYSVSTSTAAIFYTEEDDSKKIYDRHCEMQG